MVATIRNGDSDFRRKKNSGGGSQKGKDMRKCPRVLKYFAYKWAMVHIANDNETYFMHCPGAKGRFTARVFYRIIPILWELWPEECHKYFDDRPPSYDYPEKQLYEAHLIADRFHKMFYWNTVDESSRGTSREHPKHWRVLPDISRSERYLERLR